MPFPKILSFSRFGKIPFRIDAREKSRSQIVDFLNRTDTENHPPDVIGVHFKMPVPKILILSRFGKIPIADYLIS